MRVVCTVYVRCGSACSCKSHVFLLALLCRRELSRAIKQRKDYEETNRVACRPNRASPQFFWRLFTCPIVPDTTPTVPLHYRYRTSTVPGTAKNPTLPTLNGLGITTLLLIITLRDQRWPKISLCQVKISHYPAAKTERCWRW